MKHGSVPRSITKQLEEVSIEPYNAPDGLTETAINILLGETYRELDESTLRRPSDVKADSAEKRRTRRAERRVLRALPTTNPVPALSTTTDEVAA
ncbi:hypothetical protein [Saccharopolyspora taberi]|uniref:Uncharacterized protein n=1 Tax=Saccharopolyspora taberi TaxID=60895 RepID=A0ABN3V4I1_9PSEU